MSAGTGVTVTRDSGVPGALPETIVSANGDKYVEVGTVLVANGATEIVIDGVTTTFSGAYQFTVGTDDIAVNP